MTRQEQAIALYREGVSVRQIRTVCRCTHTTLYCWLDAAGEPRRNRQWNVERGELEPDMKRKLLAERMAQHYPDRQRREWILKQMGVWDDD